MTLGSTNAPAEHEVCVCRARMKLPRLSPAARETMIVWTFRIGFTMVGVLSLYLFVRGS